MMHADDFMIVCVLLAHSALSMLVSSLNTHMDHVMHALAPSCCSSYITDILGVYQYHQAFDCSFYAALAVG